jgi:hypothetical protein
MMVNGGEAVGPHPVDEQQHAKLPHATVSDMVSAVSASVSSTRPEAGWPWYQHQYC